ncbi:MAG TPA: 2-oxoglutarate dehydrogenase E1 component, partial [Prolixibacteraceae bacterium]|nr:2-oxoglutarate dehydrogenase E1 component [Prolixibacteraceae bacterium]
MENDSPLSNLDITAIEELYQKYSKDPNQLDQSWVNFFMGFELAAKYAENKSAPTPGSNVKLDKEFKILGLIQGYRQRGHLFTRTNPVRTRRQYSPTLDIENFGLQQSDMDTVFEAGSEIGLGPSTLRQIVGHLQDTYCESVGVEYVYMRDPELVKWLQSKMESSRNRQEISTNKKLHIYDHLK